jgi:arginase family enzyme
LNPQPRHDYSRLLADQVEAILDNGEFPVVLGGDCSLLLGRCSRCAGVDDTDGSDGRGLAAAIRSALAG